MEASPAFSLPQIQDSPDAPHEKAAYLIAHYWDKFDFTDTTLISRLEITEQAWADYLTLLPHVTLDKAEKSLTTLLEAASTNTFMFSYFTELSEKYLYEPNFPYRNEDYYISILKYIVSSSPVDELDKIRPHYQLEMALKNRPGEVAKTITARPR